MHGTSNKLALAKRMGPKIFQASTSERRPQVHPQPQSHRATSTPLELLPFMMSVCAPPENCYSNRRRPTIRSGGSGTFLLAREKPNWMPKVELCDGLKLRSTISSQSL